MKLEQSFTVAADPDRVYATLLDIERVATCLPGADISEDRGDGTWAGSFTVKLGPTTASYTGTLHVEERDDAERRATLAARGQDKRGQGGASATIVSSVAEDEAGGARVDVVTDYSITGRLARFGRGGMVQDIANRLLRDFAGNLQAMLAEGDRPSEHAPAPLAEPADAPGPSDPPAAGGQLEAAAPTMAASAPAQGSAAAGGGAATAGGGASSVPAGSGVPHRPQAKPVGGFSLVLRALWDRVRALFGRRR